MTALDFQQGQRVLYVDLEENSIIHRFLFPLSEELRQKIDFLNDSKYAVKIDSMGEGTIKEKLNTLTPVTFSSIPSMATLAYEVDLTDHPYIQQGVGYVSEDFLEFLGNLKQPEERIGVVEAKPSLAESLRAQIQAPQETPVSSEVAISTPPAVEAPAPTPTNEVKLEDFIAKKKKETAHKLTTEQMVKEMHQLLIGKEQEVVTGKEISSWFIQYSAAHGMDQAFEYLAQRISHWG